MAELKGPSIPKSFKPPESQLKSTTTNPEYAFLDDIEDDENNTPK